MNFKLNYTQEIKKNEKIIMSDVYGLCSQLCMFIIGEETRKKMKRNEFRKKIGVT